MNIQRVWQDFLMIVTEEAGSRVVETWLKAVTFKEWDDINYIAYLVAPNTFVKDWINTKYLTLLETHLKRLLHVTQLKIVLVDHDAPQPLSPRNASPEVISLLPQAKVTPTAERPSASHAVARASRHITLTDQYTFSNFVIGPHNQLAYAAAQAVCKQPGAAYNPLFIYGASGLGKTHLLHAIGNETRANHKRASIVYQPADRFVSEFIQAIRFDKVQLFKDKYKNVDVLLVDDIQSIAGKDQTQEAFFHIFNTLYENNKQIIFTSDTYPREMTGITARLRSRLEWGLVADIGVPTIETRIAILARKADSSPHPIEQKVLEFIAAHAPSNVRQLEGAFIRVMAFASLTGQSVSLELAQKVLGLPPSPEPQRARVITFDMVTDLIEKEYGYSLAQLRSPSRHKGMSFARQVAMYLMKRNTAEPLTEIARHLRRSDHTTVMHAVQKIEHAVTQDLNLKNDIERLEERLKQG